MPQQADADDSQKNVGDQLPNQAVASSPVSFTLRVAKKFSGRTAIFSASHIRHRFFGFLDKTFR